MPEYKPDLIRSTVLCLACSSSLPPKSERDLFMTECCGRPICPVCISSNPRLRRYNPCLSCLGGVGVVSSASARNVCPPNNGTVQDEDIFVLGDDEDEDKRHELDSVSSSSSVSPPASSSTSSSTSSLTSESTLIIQTNDASAEHAEVVATGEQYIPSKYYIKPRDTLQGIALRYRFNVRYATGINGHH